MAGVSVRVSSTKPGSGTAVATTDAAGKLLCEVPLPVSVAAVNPKVRLVLPAQVYEAAVADVYACRVARITCDVLIVDNPVPRPEVQVFATPSHRERGEWIADPERIGSSEWLRRNALELTTTRVRSKSEQVVIETPVFPEVTFAAAAAGYLPDTQSVSFLGVDPESVHVRLTLRKARRIAIQVTDQEGTPVSGAMFQYAVERRGSAELVNPMVEFMLQQATGAGFTATSSRDRNASQVNEIVQARTDVNGMAALDEPGQGSSDYVIVWAEGFEPFISRRDNAAPSDEPIEVKLRPFARICDSYRLIRGGAPLRRVSIVLAEKLEGGFTPSLPTISADREGRINSGLIVPGRRYFASVFDQEHEKTYRGDLTFGNSSDVDADVLSE